MAMPLKEFKKSTFKNTYYFKEIKTKEDLENLRKETIELTKTETTNVYMNLPKWILLTQMTL